MTTLYRAIIDFEIDGKDGGECFNMASDVLDDIVKSMLWNGDNIVKSRLKVFHMAKWEKCVKRKRREPK